MKALWWWLQECWWSFPFKPRRKSPVGDGKLRDYMPADLYKTFKDVGDSYPLHIGVYEWQEYPKDPVRIDDDTKE